MPAFRDADLNTKAHSTSMPTFLAFRLTVFFFFLWFHSTPWETRAIHVKVISVSLKQSGLPSLSHHLSSPTSGGITWRGMNPQARSHLSFFPGKGFPPSLLSVAAIGRVHCSPSVCGLWLALEQCWGPCLGGSRWCLCCKSSGPMLYLIPFEWIPQCSADHVLTSTQHHTLPFKKKGMNETVKEKKKWGQGGQGGAAEGNHRNSGALPHDDKLLSHPSNDLWTG